MKLPNRVVVIASSMRVTALKETRVDHTQCTRTFARLACRLGVAILVLASAAGCTTTLLTQNVEKGAAPGPGLLYNLPRASFDIEARFLVTDCLKVGEYAALSYELTSGTVQHQLVGDSTETYRLRYDKLNSPMKITSASVVMHPNGMIKSVNVEQDDRTAQVMASLATTAINLFKAYALGVAPAAGPGAKAEDRCDAAITKRLADRKALQDKLPAARQADVEFDADTTAADTVAAKLQVASARLAEAKKGSDAKATADAQAEVDRLNSEWKVASAKLKGRSKAAGLLQAKLDRINADLTATARVLGWSPSGDGDTLCRDVELDQRVFLAQFQATHGETIALMPKPTDKFVAQACVTGVADARRSPPAVSAAARAGADGKTDVAAAPPEFDGIVYRLPTLGSVTLSSGSTTLVGATSVSIPQLGAKAMLWLENKPFDQNTLQAEFNEDGSLSTLTFKALAARAERGAAAVADTSRSLVDLMQLRADAAKAKAEAATQAQKKEQQAQIDALDQQIALLGKRRELEAARAPTTDPLDKQKERLQKQIDVEKLRQEYEALKQKAPAP